MHLLAPVAAYEELRSQAFSVVLHLNPDVVGGPQRQPEQNAHTSTLGHHRSLERNEAEDC